MVGSIGLIVVVTMVTLIGLFTILSYRYSASDSSVTWIKSSLSSYNGNCVEVAGLTGDRIKVRDSKHPRKAVLTFSPAEWDAFIDGVYNGEFNRKPRIEQTVNTGEATAV